MSDERITLNCPSCAAHLRVPTTAAGKRVRCPKCKAAIAVDVPVEIPVAAAPVGGVLDSDLLSGLAQGTAVEAPEDRQARQQAIAVARARAKVVTEEAPNSATPRQRYNWGGFLVNIGGAIVPRGMAGRLNFAGLAIGCMLVCLGVFEHRLRGRAQADPQTIACQTLLEDGPGDNLHLLLTDFMVLPYYVYETGISGKWHGVWAPAVPRATVDEHVAAILNVPLSELTSASDEQLAKAFAQLKPADFSIKLIVSFPEADGQEYVESRLFADSLQGVLFTDGLSSMSRRGGDRKRLLQDAYPHLDVNNCWVLVVGRAPASAARANAYLFGGGALAIGSLLVAAKRAAAVT